MTALWQSFRRLFAKRPARHAGTATPSLFRLPRLEWLEQRQAPAAHDTLATAIPLSFNPSTLMAESTANGSPSTYYRFTAPGPGPHRDGDTRRRDGYLAAADPVRQREQLLIQSDAVGQGGAARWTSSCSPELTTWPLAQSPAPPTLRPRELTWWTLLRPGLPPFQPLPVGTGPRSTAAGDSTTTATSIWVAANFGDNTVSVMPGRGDGTFKSAVTYQVGAGPSAVAVGDFNHDGNLDLATANSSDGTVSVLLGNGDGSFRPPSTSVSEPLPIPGGSDFNHDGKLDLVTANRGSNTLSVFWEWATALPARSHFHSWARLLLPWRGRY